MNRDDVISARVEDFTQIIINYKANYRKGNNSMRHQLTYMGRSANQILKGAQISVMGSGIVHITHDDYPHCLLFQSDEGDLIINSCDKGNYLYLICGQSALRLLQELEDKCKEKQWSVLVEEDLKNGTCYTDILGDQQ